MTGSAFLKRLLFQLDFLPEEDRQTVIQYYRKKLSYADTISEEEEIVKSFGSPEHICAKLKEAVEEKQKVEAAAQEKAEKISLTSDDVGVDPNAPAVPAEQEDLTPLPKAEPDPAFTPAQDEDLTSIPAPEKSDAAPEGEADEENAAEPEDVIFSKPPVREEAPEIIQSLEGRESFNLYGEKVVLDEPLEQEDPLPAEEDDIPPEELKQAKANALEKAEQFGVDAFGTEEEAPVSDESHSEPEETKAEVPAPEESGSSFAAAEKETFAPIASDVPEKVAPSEEKNAVSYPEDEEEEPAVTREYSGIFRKMFPHAQGAPLLTLKILFSVLFSPVLLLIFGIGVSLYVGLTVSLVLVSLVLFVLMIGFIIGGVVELVYGVVQLFSSVPVGLIEIGLGTVLFGVVTAVVGLIYEFLFGVVPRALKWLTSLCKKYLRLLAAVIYGGRV